MTDEERRAAEADCARLIALYANLNDEARWDEVVALYAEDGVMVRPTAPDAPIHGREAILAAFKSRPARTTRHVCSNVVITLESADTARGVSAMLRRAAGGLVPRPVRAHCRRLALRRAARLAHIRPLIGAPG